MAVNAVHSSTDSQQLGDIPLKDRSIIELWGWNRTTCGYCNTTKSSRLFAAWSEHLYPHDYFLLMNRGWRRSGKYLYRPNNGSSCCQQLTIRMEAARFTPSKSQSKVLRRFEKFVQPSQEVPTRGGSAKTGNSQGSSRAPKRPRHGKHTGASNEAHSAGKVQVDESSKRVFRNLIQRALLSLDKSRLGISDKVDVSNLQYNLEFRTQASKQVSCEGREKRKKKAATTANVSSNVAFILAAVERSCTQSSRSYSYERQMVLCRAIANALRSVSQKNLIQNVESTPPGFLNIWTNLLLPTSPCSSHDDREAQRVPPSSLRNKNPHTIPLPRGRNLNITLVRPVFQRDAFNLYQRYQQVIHSSPPKDNPERSYQRFLVDSPLVKHGHYGSFHMRYAIDDKLIAVGVVDIVPGCLSSVYFFYDPDLKDLTLGVVSVFKEIDWIRNVGVKTLNLDLKWYYMGYAIYGCQKMEYKFRFRPSFVLDDKTWSWIPVETVLADMDANDGRIACRSIKTGWNTSDEAGPNVNGELMLVDVDNAVSLATLEATYGGFHKKAIKEAKSRIRTWLRIIGDEGKSRFLYPLMAVP
eukprot:Plantae.Rhodophyta-Hildenbrandia_rubra.ctg1313.p1 GENE.Plantae.Rhodophyta-Hildenbrandia_rubra.ctg1313~~Plantae.Rhodophyta-Hildenbrandia_rubra.ctg1313.p1  ORF type:complete len:581 (+),score=53.37 Plantae.Rhodophyta-Hildenbrandia_rubra.ctg1313:434-2176(+)